MILALLGVAIASTFALLFDFVESVLPGDAWDSALSVAGSWSFIVPPTFASTAPLAVSALLAIGGIKMLLNLVGRR